MISDQDLWKPYALECLKNIDKELLALHAKEIEKETQKLIAEANAAGRVFLTPTGKEQNFWVLCEQDNLLVPSHDTHEGWRELSDGSREPVWYYYGWGWLSTEELSEMRRTDPRCAP